MYPYSLRPAGRHERWHLKAFLLGFGVSVIFFLPFIIYDQGYFLYYGDFNVQQVPFYQMIHDAIRSGNFFWSWTTDLGANTIGSYTFYLLGSPFFWLTLPFPSHAVPYLMGPLLMLKMGCASLTAYIYLKRYVRNPNTALIGAMLYAFSGYSIYNIFFNHFHEAIIFFPLLLAALDEYMATKRRGLFALAVFACCFVNYYFFTGMVAFCLIYWFVRMFANSWKITLGEFFWLLFEAVVGVGLTAVLLLPTILAVIQNPRIDNPPQGWGALLYGNEQRYIHILQCLFFPPDIPARPNFTPDSNAKWASLGAWLPLFSMSGVIAWLQTQKRDWLKRLLILLFFMAMVPVLNSAFQLFNSSYYARWFYILTLMMSLATVRSLESVQVDWKRSIKWTMGITAAIAIPIAFIPQEINNDDGTTTTKIGLMQYPDRFWIYVAIAFASLLLLIIALRFLKRDRKMFYRVTLVSISVITVIYSAYIIGLGKSQSYDTHNFIIPYSLNQGEDIDLPDSDVESRIDIYEGMDNQAMFWQMPTIQAFHSIVPGSIMEFYPTIGVTRDVGSRPETDVYGLRALTSTRWLFDYTGDTAEFESTTNSNDTKMPGWSFYDTQNGFDIWENRYFIPYGFTYDQYMTREQYDNIAESSRHLALLKAIVLEDDAIERNQDILTQAPTDSFRYGEADYFQDCLNRKSDTCSTFTRDNYGFTATYTAGAQDELVFFSVPWEAGWSATVNGEEAIIEKVNIGFMAVRVPANTESTIRFNYTTPGLKAGALITVGFLLLFVVSLILIKKWDQKHPKLLRKTYRIK